MARKRIIVLGGGLTGLSAAWHLKNKGVDCLVIEKEPDLGGLCRSQKIKGFTFDRAGHLLHFKDPASFALIKRLLKPNLLEHQRSAWVYHSNKYHPYPFQANLYNLPARVIKECLLSLIDNVKKEYCAGGDENFYSWMNHKFGAGIARYFMIPYNAKFWTISPRRLSCGWFNDFVPNPALGQILDGALDKSGEDFGYNCRFWYPRRGGIQVLPLAFADKLENIRVNSEITGIDLKSRVIKGRNGVEEQFDYLISTIPMPELPALIPDMPAAVRASAKRLNWNSIFNLNIGAAGNGMEKKNWIYYPQKGISFFRVGFFNSFSSQAAPGQKSSLYTEVSYSRNKPINKKTIVPKIKRDLINLKILGRSGVFAENINDIKYGYPIYDRQYPSARRNMLHFLAKNRVVSCGRFGSWSYMSMEGAIRDGQRAANLVVNNV